MVINAMFDAKTSKYHPRTALKRTVCLLVGLGPMRRRGLVTMATVDGVKEERVMVPGSKVQVTTKSAVKMFHVLEQCGLVRGLPSGFANPDDADEAAYARHRAAVKQACLELAAKGSAAVTLSGAALLVLKDFVLNPRSACGCTLCEFVKETAAKSDTSEALVRCCFFLLEDGRCDAMRYDARYIAMRYDARCDAMPCRCNLCKMKRCCGRDCPLKKGALISLILAAAVVQAVYCRQQHRQRR